MDTSVSVKTNQFNPVILIPFYNHYEAFVKTLDNISVYNLPILIVDDGSDNDSREQLLAMCERFQGTIHLTHLSENRGKGAAVKKGFSRAAELGFSHAIQVDADGQHDAKSIPRFLEQAAASPEKIIIGFPEYDKSVPKLRFYCRYLTHIWVWINTLSLTIKDSMCGFRVYPIQRINTLIHQHDCGNRMEFDTEVLVRWVWQGYQVDNLPTKVHYPENGVSHFLVWRDNVLISWMHTRLFFGMLLRSPKLLTRLFTRLFTKQLHHKS